MNYLCLDRRAANDGLETEFDFCRGPLFFKRICLV